MPSENKGISIELIVPQDVAGLRLDQVLAKLLPQWSRSRLQSWINEKHITVNGQTTTVKQKLWGSETILIIPPIASNEQTDQAEAIPLAIVYEDEDILIIDKPVGLVVHPGNGNKQGTLLNALLHHSSQFANVSRAGIVHRLDKDTSGLLVIAKNIEAQTSLVRQLQQRTMKREYLAIVWGEVKQEGWVDAPIGRHSIHRTRMAITAKGKPARTHYRVLTLFKGYTLLQCSLDTGRTHQIRVHMHSIGHPLIGDSVYTDRTKQPPKEVGHSTHSFHRQALHAYRLTLEHPTLQRAMSWESSLPQDIKELLNQLSQL